MFLELFRIFVDLFRPILLVAHFELLFDLFSNHRPLPDLRSFGIPLTQYQVHDI